MNEDKAEALLDRDWSTDWDSLPEAPDLVPAGRRFRVLVTGGRSFDDYALVFRRLVNLKGNVGNVPVTLVHGAARGADRLAATAAVALGFDVEAHAASWRAPCRPECQPGHRQVAANGRSWCPAAGSYRNQKMADLGADLCLAFPGGRGTRDMVRRAAAAGIPIERVPRA